VHSGNRSNSRFLQHKLQAVKQQEAFIRFYFLEIFQVGKWGNVLYAATEDTMNESGSLAQFQLFPAVVLDQQILWTITGTDSPSVIISFLKLNVNTHYG